MAHIAGAQDKACALEKSAVFTSLDNLMTFPVVPDAIAFGDLTRHGLWTDIGDGCLDCDDLLGQSLGPV